MDRLVRCYIEDYDKETGQFIIRKLFQVNDITYNARLISPLPYDFEGGGLRAIPEHYVGMQCLALDIEGEYFIFGFLPPALTLRGATYNTVELEPGDTQIGHHSGTSISFFRRGLIGFFANKWAQLNLDKLTRRLFGNLKNIAISMYNGFISWVYDDDEQSGHAEVEVRKSVDLTSTVPTALPPDKINIKAGQLDDEHLLEINTHQDEDAIRTNSKLGKQNNNNIYEATFEDDDDNFRAYIRINTNGQLFYEIEKDNNKTNLTFDPAGSTMMRIATSRNSEIRMNNNGDITLDVGVNNNVYLGGESQATELATKNFVQAYYEKHTHVSASPGSPTSPPMMPSPVVPQIMPFITRKSKGE